MKKILAILLSLAILIMLGTFLFNNQDTADSEKRTPDTEHAEDAESEEIEEGNQADNTEILADTFTFEPFTLSVEMDDNVEVGKPFEVSASLKNTYNGPVTLKSGSKCTKDVTLVLTPFEDYKENQTPPDCEDPTEDIEVLVGESLDTTAEFIAEHEGKYIVSAYFANMPLLKKAITVGNSALDVKDASSNLGSLSLNVVAEGEFKVGEPIFLSSALSNTGDNFIRLLENSCQLAIQFTVKANDKSVETPETFGPCQDENRKFNLQAGNTLNSYSSFLPEEKGTYSVKVFHINEVSTVLEFDVN